MTGTHRIGRRAVLGLLAAAPLPAFAQPAYPTRQIRILVPFAAGGTTDILARALGERLAASFGQPVVIENRGGAGGLVAGEAFAHAEADGHTLLVATASLISINKALYPSLPFDPDVDFLPAAMIAQQPNVLVINPRALPVVTLPELIAYIRTRPGQLAFASAGTGSQLHLTGEMFRAAAGLEMAHVPYRGSAPAMTDLLAGNVPMMFDGLGTSLPQIRGGAIRCIATASPEPSAVLPGVATVASALPGFTSMNWTALFVLRGTPPTVRDRLEQAARQAVASPEMQKLFADRAFEPFPLSRDELRAFLAAEAVRWREAVRSSGARAD